MEASRRLERLVAYQETLLERIAAGEALLEQGPMQAAPLLAKSRWEMVRLLREYQLFKHREIFDPAILGPSRRIAALATAARDWCRQASERYETHVTRWSETGIAGDWDAYRMAVRDMGKAIRLHIAAERADVRTILVQKAGVAAR
jgi:hypothetical protein